MSMTAETSNARGEVVAVGDGSEFDIAMRAYEFAAIKHGKTGDNAPAVDAAGARVFAMFNEAAAPPPAAARGDVRGLVDALVDAAYQDGMQELDAMSDETLSARSALELALAAEGVQAPKVDAERALKDAVFACIAEGRKTGRYSGVMYDGGHARVDFTVEYPEGVQAGKVEQRVGGDTPARLWLDAREAEATQDWQDGFNVAHSYFAAQQPEARGVVDVTDAMVERGVSEYRRMGFVYDVKQGIRKILPAALTGERNG